VRADQYHDAGGFGQPESACDEDGRVIAEPHRLARIIFSGMNDIEEWKLGDPARAAAKGYPRDYPAELIDDFGMIFVDLTVDAATGSLVCHEVNGPNAVGSDALTGDSSLRAENEARQAIRRAREFGYLLPDGTLRRPLVTVHAHQHWPFFRTGGEFYPRVDQFADVLRELLPGVLVRCRAATDPPGDEQISVVMGDVPAVAAMIQVDEASQRFEIAGRPVVFVGNPNLLPELIRIGRLGREARTSDSRILRVLHAWRLAGVIHDKGLQQDLLEGTGIRPLRHFSAATREETAGKAGAMLSDHAVVLKPSLTSGGCGVHVIVPGMSEDEISACIDVLLADCRAKYGDDAEVFPLQGFEFVRSTGYPMEDGDHLWDLRIAVLFEPGKARAFPVSLRFAPQPFDARSFQLHRDQWVSNVSGRQQTLLKSGMDDDVLGKVGLSDDLIEEAMRACVTWTIKAWDRSVRDGGSHGAVYEDAREEADEPFYRWERFGG
jgi:hypothetical protein